MECGKLFTERGWRCLISVANVKHFNAMVIVLGKHGFACVHAYGCIGVCGSECTGVHRCVCLLIFARVCSVKHPPLALTQSLYILEAHTSIHLINSISQEQ